MIRTEDIQLAETVLSGASPITPPDAEEYHKVKASWDALAKPLDGFGRLEGLTSRIGGIQEKNPPDLHHAAVLVLASDNGIVKEGVSQSGQEITALCAGNIAKGHSTLGPLSKRTGAAILVYDLGIAGDTPEGVRDEKIRAGTKDFLTEPAMTKEETLAAIGTGIRLVGEQKARGITLVCTGEMGIGNTTTSAALLAALLSLPAERTAGRGAGLSDEGLQRKQEVIRLALKKYQKDLSDPLRILSDVGGFDLAGLAGVCLGGALYHVPVILDGIISQTAALVAKRLLPEAAAFWLPSHKSEEPAGEALTEALGLSPVLDAGLSVGEGTGALLMLELLQGAVSVLTASSAFAGYGMTPYRRQDHGE